MFYSLLMEKISDFFRKKRMSNFIDLLRVSQKDKILDVGGLPDYWHRVGLAKNVTLLNINESHKSNSIKTIKGDARNMKMYFNKSIDIVFSNSVIEHVGNFSDQKLMAKEILRIGKKYWIQTPNKHFPIELHFCFPFLQYLPRNFQELIVQYWPFSFSKKLGLDPINELKNLRLITYSEMKILFPDSIIIKEKFMGFTKSLIAYNNSN
jgi:hypothetical protein